MTDTLMVPRSLLALSPLDREAAERARGRALALMDRLDITHKGATESNYDMAVMAVIILSGAVNKLAGDDVGRALQACADRASCILIAIERDRVIRDG